MTIPTLLQQFGLTPKEVSLYLAALELGSASVQKIAQKAGVVRSTAYEVLEQLRDKHVVTTFLKKKTRYYSAEDPQQLMRFAESKLTALKMVLPQLEAITGKSRHRPATRFYEGKEGMKIILEEILSEADELVALTSPDELFRELPFFPEFVALRVKKKIPLKVIHPESSKALERKKLGKQELREVRFVPPTYPCHGLMYIWKQKIAFFSFQNDYVAIVVESKEISEMQRMMFRHLWDTLLP